MTDLMWLTSQEERSQSSIDELVSMAADRLSSRTRFDDLAEADQDIVRSALRVFDLYCANCGTPGRAYLPPDAEAWNCEACS